MGAGRVWSGEAWAQEHERPRELSFLAGRPFPRHGPFYSYLLLSANARTPCCHVPGGDEPCCKRGRRSTRSAAAAVSMITRQSHGAPSRLGPGGAFRPVPIPLPALPCSCRGTRHGQRRRKHEHRPPERVPETDGLPCDTSRRGALSAGAPSLLGRPQNGHSVSQLQNHAAPIQAGPARPGLFSSFQTTNDRNGHFNHDRHQRTFRLASGTGTCRLDTNARYDANQDTAYDGDARGKGRAVPARSGRRPTRRGQVVSVVAYLSTTSAHVPAEVDSTHIGTSHKFSRSVYLLDCSP